MERLQFRDFIVRESTYSPGARLSRHAHDYSNISVVTDGAIEEASELGRHRGLASSVVVKPARAEHENRVSGHGARTIAIEMHGDSEVGRQIAVAKWAWFDEAPIVREAIALQAV